LIESSTSISTPAPLRPTRAERRRQERETRQPPSLEELRQVVRQDGFLAMSCEIALSTLVTLMEDDANRLCGVEQKGKHSKTRTGYRNGYELGSIVVGGRRVEVERPRVVGLEGGDLAIESYQAARHPEFLNQAALTACIQGVSQRKHRGVLEALAPLGHIAQDATGLSKSAVGRRFVATADQKAAEMLARPLEERFLAVWMDGIQEAGYAVVCAVGLTETGQKRVLGLRQGTTEDTVLCREFLEGLVVRGFTAEGGVLFVIDGGKGLARALREVFGNNVLVQRCRIHKKRNVMEKLTLTGDARETIERRIDELWSHPNARTAQAHLELLARGLTALGQTTAAGSLREGAREMFTCTRIGVPDELERSLTNTNTIESAFSQYATVAVRVKRWQNGQQILRWASVGVLEAEKAFSKTGTVPLLQRLASVLVSPAATPRQQAAVHVAKAA
jgi:putative transposase